MKRFLCENLPQKGRPTELSADETAHALRVLRLKTGDQVLAVDGKGKSVEASVRVAGKTAFLDWIGPGAGAENDTLPIHLELSILKGQAMEWAIEKAVELGVRQLTPVLADHSVVKISGKGPEAFVERWQKIANQSLKQCERLTQMTVEMPMTVEALLTRRQTPSRIWCDETRTSPQDIGEFLESKKPHDVSLLIGPEGGWSEKERKLLTQIPSVHLGPRILRAETAVIYTISVTAQHFQKNS